MNGVYTIKHSARCIIQHLIKPELAIIGGYHLGNFGDLLLGNSIKEICNQKGIKSGLQTIYNLEKWPKINHAIIGGGAVGYEYSLQKLIKRYKNSPEKIGFLGVDFNEKQYSKESIQFLKDVKFITCRSEIQQIKIKNLTGRNDILFHQDLAFSFRRNFFKEIKLIPSERRPKLFINILPLYATLKNDKLIPKLHYQKENPHFFEHFDEYQKAYLKLISEIITIGKENNFEIETLPYSFQDESMAKNFIHDTSIKQNKYDINLQNNIKRIKPNDWVFSTRLHVTIMAIKAGAKLTALTYADKNVRLLNDLNIKENQFIRLEDLLKPIEQLKSIHFIPDNNLINTVSDSVSQIIENKIFSLINE